MELQLCRTIVMGLDAIRTAGENFPAHLALLIYVATEGSLTGRGTYAPRPSLRIVDMRRLRSFWRWLLHSDASTYLRYRRSVKGCQRVGKREDNWYADPFGDDSP